MPISSVHPEYSAHKPDWELMRDTISGKRAMLQPGRDINYLPRPNPDDKSPANDQRYQEYKQRAFYFNAPDQTRAMLHGMLFRRPVEIELPRQLEYLEDDADNAGLGLEQQIKDSSSEGLITGNGYLFVDYPSAEAGLTEEQSRGLRAGISLYPVELLTNWDDATYGGVKKVSLLVFREVTLERDPGQYEFTAVTRYRELLLDEDGLYVQRLVDEDEVTELWRVEPTDAAGNRWDEIPVAPFGSQNNDWSKDKPPIIDTSRLAISHLQAAADYAESSHITGQPTLFVISPDHSYSEANKNSPIRVGSRGGQVVPGQNAKVELIQAAPNQMPLELMRTLEAQMRMIGAQLIADKEGGDQTATASRQRGKGQTSELGSIANNVESAYNKCLGFASRFMGAPETGKIVINREFYEAGTDAQILAQAISGFTAGVLDAASARKPFRDAGIIDAEVSDEEVDDNIEMQDPTGGLKDGGAGDKEDGGTDERE